MNSTALLLFGAGLLNGADWVDAIVASLVFYFLKYVC